MRYQLVRWDHDLDDEPILLYSEIDSSGLERRKVEEYRSGRRDVAGTGLQTGSTRLSETVIPNLIEINSDGEFTGHAINAEAFEEAWQAAVGWSEPDARACGWSSA